MQIIINELQLKRLIEKEIPKESFVDWRTQSAGQPIFDYIRQWEEFVPFTYDDYYFPPRVFTGTTKDSKGTLTIGYGTTDSTYAYPGNNITKKFAEEISHPDIQDAADCIKRWQGRAKEGDDFSFNNRKITKGMYFVMTDIAYNMGCQTFIKTKTIEKIEKGKYKLAKDYIQNKLDWGHPKRRDAAAQTFCQEGLC
jgi:GH24 family phage-related lysozyme (muramidase)